MTHLAPASTGDDVSDLDMTDVVLLLEAALTQARDLHGSPAVFDRDVKENRAAAAVQTRRLNLVTHFCERAAAETNAVLWSLKGFPDPLREDAT